MVSYKEFVSFCEAFKDIRCKKRIYYQIYKLPSIIDNNNKFNIEDSYNNIVKFCNEKSIGIHILGVLCGEYKIEDIHIDKLKEIYNGVCGILISSLMYDRTDYHKAKDKNNDIYIDIGYEELCEYCRLIATDDIYNKTNISDLAELVNKAIRILIRYENRDINKDEEDKLVKDKIDEFMKTLNSNITILINDRIFKEESILWTPLEQTKANYINGGILELLLKYITKENTRSEINE